jgi:hypothetical protein
MNRILYKTDEGGVAVIIPAPECLQTRTIQEIAIKDVPSGKPFKIVDASDLPTDIPQEGWTVDESELTDGIGGESNEFEPVGEEFKLAE